MLPLNYTDRTRPGWRASSASAPEGKMFGQNFIFFHTKRMRRKHAIK